MQTIIQMRFSFFGHSGWQSDASKDPDALFNPARLRKRFEYFERIALASLRDQTDRDFKLAILSSKRLPNRFKNRLKEMCLDTLGEEHCDLLFRHPAKAGRIFRMYTQRRYADQDYVAQVVLDDDDALASGWVDIVSWARMARQDILEGRTAVTAQPDEDSGAKSDESEITREHLEGSLQRLHDAAERRRELRMKLTDRQNGTAQPVAEM